MKNSLRTVRIQHSFTQAELAEKVMVSRQTIISIESGRYLPSVLLAMKISKALGCAVEELFEIEKSD